MRSKTMLVLALAALAALATPIASRADAMDGASDGSPTVLVTGANRGLGLEYARQFIDKGYHVIGTARKPAEADELKALGAEVMALDVADDASVSDLAEALEGRPIDILINNAGIFDRRDVDLAAADADMFLRTIDINTAGPLRVTQALMPNLKAGERKKVISMSSGLGSIENSTGGWYAYRSSKTALNQVNKIWSEEFKGDGFIFTVVHPGWVQTDMGGANATYTPEESVTGLIAVIEELDAEDNGRFYDLKGETIPW